MVEPKPELLNIREGGGGRGEGASPSSSSSPSSYPSSSSSFMSSMSSPSSLSSSSSFQQMRKQRHRKLQASQEHRREGRRLQAECHELRRRVEELALLESLLLKHISKEIYGTLKPKSRNSSKETTTSSTSSGSFSPIIVSQIPAEKHSQDSESVKEFAADDVIKEDPGNLKKLQQELSQIQTLATHERAALDRATHKLEAHFLERRAYVEREEDERALKDSEVEESRLKTASVERELQSLSRGIARLEQLCQDLGDDLGTFSYKAQNGSGKAAAVVFAAATQEEDPQNDNNELQIPKVQKNLVLVELERLQGEKAELEKEAKDRRHGILGTHRRGDQESMSARSTGGFDQGVPWSSTSSESDTKCLEDDYGLASSYSGYGEISSVNSKTTSESFMPKHEGRRSNPHSSVTKRLDFGAPETTDPNSVQPPLRSVDVGDGSPQGKAFVDVDQDDDDDGEEVEDGWAEEIERDRNSDAKDVVGLELQKLKEADSHTTHVLVQLQNAREEFEQEILDMKDAIAGEKTTEDVDDDSEWMWGSQEERQLKELLFSSGEAERFLPQQDNPAEVYQASNDPSSAEQFAPETAEPPYSASLVDGNVLLLDFRLAKSSSMDDELEGIAFESREILPPTKPQIADEEEKMEETPPDTDGKNAADNPELRPKEGEEVSFDTDQSISVQEPEAGNRDGLLEGAVRDMDATIPSDMSALPLLRNRDEEGKETASDTDQNIPLQEQPEADNRDELLEGTMDETVPPDVLALPPHRNQDEEGNEISSDKDQNQSIASPPHWNQDEEGKEISSNKDRNQSILTHSDEGPQNTQREEHGNADDLLTETAPGIEDGKEKDEELVLDEHVVHESGTTDEKMNKVGIELDVARECRDGVGGKLDGMSPDYEDVNISETKLSEDVENQAEKLRDLNRPIDESANELQRQQKLREEPEPRLDDIVYKERWVQDETRLEAPREVFLPVSVMPWSEETEKVSLVLEHQQFLLQNQVEEAEKLRCAAEKRVDTLNNQIQDLEVICDIAQSIESVLVCKDEALQFMVWTLVQALLLCLSLLVWLNRFMDPMEGSLRPT